MIAIWLSAPPRWKLAKSKSSTSAPDAVTWLGRERWILQLPPRIYWVRKLSKLHLHYWR
jgi:hypothetical protein